MVCRSAHLHRSFSSQIYGNRSFCRFVFRDFAFCIFFFFCFVGFFFYIVFKVKLFCTHWFLSTTEYMCRLQMFTFVMQMKQERMKYWTDFVSISSFWCLPSLQFLVFAFIHQLQAWYCGFHSSNFVVANPLCKTSCSSTHVWNGILWKHTISLLLNLYTLCKFLFLIWHVIVFSSSLCNTYLFGQLVRMNTGLSMCVFVCLCVCMHMYMCMCTQRHMHAHMPAQLSVLLIFWFFFFFGGGNRW